MRADFFHTTTSARTQVTALFDFVWPTATAMWNLRWQVQGFLGVVPGATVGDLNARFIHTSKIHGANLTRACIEQSWDQQLEFFAHVLLTNLFAIYEGWIESTLKVIQRHNTANVKGLQFPIATSGTNVNSWRATVNRVTTPESAVMKAAFYSKLKAQSKYSMSSLDNLLKCYRYFKEVRNSYIHRSGVADQKAENAYQAFLAVASITALGLSEVPEHKPVVDGSVVSLSLRGVVGLSDVVQRLLTTLDAELSRSEGAEAELYSRWRKTLGTKVNLPSNQRNRKMKIASLVRQLGFPRPKENSSLDIELKSQGLIL